MRAVPPVRADARLAATLGPSGWLHFTRFGLLPVRRLVEEEFGGLVGWGHLPPQLRVDMRRFHWDYATFKLDWALRAPVP